VEAAQESRFPNGKGPFGKWLLTQASREDAIGALAKAARADRGFPVGGDERAMSRRLNELQADGDMHEALEEAALDWAAY
jgi:hypothetical protein